MRSLVFALTLALVTTGYVAPAEAGWWSDWWKARRERIQQRRAARHPNRPHPRANPQAVPELDPSAAGGALILVTGGTYLIMNRRRRGAQS